MKKIFKVSLALLATLSLSLLPPPSAGAAKFGTLPVIFRP